MTHDSHDRVKIKMGKAYVFAASCSSSLKMLAICGSQYRLVLLDPQKVNGVNSRVLIYKLRKVAVECRLGSRLRTGDLYFLPESLKTLLFPKYWVRTGNQQSGLG